MEETPAATDTSEDPGTTPEPAAFKGDKYTLLVPQWPDNRSPEMVALTDRKTIDMLSIADFSGRILYGLPDEVQIDRSGNFMLLYQTWIPALYQPPAMNMDARMYVLLRCTGSACEADSNPIILNTETKTSRSCMAKTPSKTCRGIIWVKTGTRSMRKRWPNMLTARSPVRKWVRPKYGCSGNRTADLF